MHSAGRRAVALLVVVLGSRTSPAQPSTQPVRPRRPPCAQPAPDANAAREGGLLLASIEAERQRASRQIGLARRGRDVLWAQCLVDQLSRIDALLTTARESFGALLDAREQGDAPRAEHALRVLRIASQRALVLGRTAASCAPAPRPPAPDRTVVTVTAPAGLADVDD